MLNTTVVSKSAWKSTVTLFFMTLGIVVLGAVADFLSNAEVLSGIFTEPNVQTLLIPVFAWLGQFLKDYIKHA